MRFCVPAFLLLLAVGVCTESPAQDSRKLPDEFRTIVCDAAIDVDSPLHGLALRVVEKQRFRDPKFDEFIRHALGSENREALLTDRQMETVQRLMPYCTLPSDERVRLLLDQLEASRDALGFMTASRGRTIDLANGRYAPARIVAIAELAQHYQRELLAELKKRLDADHPHWILVSAVNLVGVDGHELLPLLMKAAKSDDVRLQYAAIDAINQLEMEKPEAGSDPQAQRRRDAATKTAEAIIRRFDKDGDNRLDSSEWDDTLFPVSQADSDQDGFVTAEELGEFMESRRRPR